MQTGRVGVATALPNEVAVIENAAVSGVMPLGKPVVQRCIGC